jgi:hypothetical protein
LIIRSRDSPGENPGENQDPGSTSTANLGHPVRGLKINFMDYVTPLWPLAGAEDGGADADFCGAFLDGDFEIVGHAHGEDGERETG